MHKVLVLGSGKIGRMIAKMLSSTGDYAVTVTDVDAGSLTRCARMPGVETALLDAHDEQRLAEAMAGKDCVLSALSYSFNPTVAEVAQRVGLSYFDLTEDRETTQRVRAVAEQANEGQIFMPQCGLAPGFVSVVANDLTRSFDKVDKVFMRVGALPQFPSNALKYNLTWSTDGLINEYCNPCEAIHNGERREVLPLEGLEHFSLDGVRYEAFNTSGGLGTLCETLEGEVRELNYKTIRYLGHRDLVAFLINELRLGERRELLKDILESAVPITYQDVVVVFCTVSGWFRGQLVQVSDARKIYQKHFDNEVWSAIQITTAAGICAMVDLSFDGALPNKGFVEQERVGLDTFLGNRFGAHYKSTVSTQFALGSDGGGLDTVT